MLALCFMLSSPYYAENYTIMPAYLTWAYVAIIIIIIKMKHYQYYIFSN